MRIELPANVHTIIETLERAGYEAFAVGGCVRDSVLGRVPADWDITTSADPFEVKALFQRTIDTGLQHGTVTVMMQKEGYEVTTYRIDGTYTDNRHPDGVSFTTDLREDLRRRDFTINAMAYSESRGLIDIFGGEKDLQAGIVRCVGEPAERFGEDALRIMRAVRFAAQLGFVIDPATKAAAAAMAQNLRYVSAERIRVELVKMLESAHPEMLETAYEMGITEVFLPEFDEMMKTEQHNPHHQYSVGVHTVKALTEVPADKVLRLAALFHDVGKPASKTEKDGIDHFYGHPKLSKELTHRLMRRLKFDNDTIDRVCTLVLHHDARPAQTQASVRRLINRAGKDAFPALFVLMRADILAQSEYMREEKLDHLSEIRRIYDQIILEKQCVTLQELAVNGKDLIQAGMRPGKEIGSCLAGMLEDVLEHPEHNTKAYLLAQLQAKNLDN